MADQIRYAHGEIKAANGIDYVMDDEIIKHNGVKLKDVVNAAQTALNSKTDKSYVDSELAKKADAAALNSKADASVVAQLQANVNTKADASTVSALSERVSTNETGLATANSRIDEIVAIPPGSTEGNTELIDIRTGADGKKYPTAGDAVRGQVTDLKSDLNEQKETINTISGIVNDKLVPKVNLRVSVELGTIDSTNGKDANSSKRARTSMMPVSSGDKIDIIGDDYMISYICIYDGGVFQSVIPNVNDKSYTFTSNMVVRPVFSRVDNQAIDITEFSDKLICTMYPVYINDDSLIRNITSVTDVTIGSLSSETGAETGSTKKCRTGMIHLAKNDYIKSTSSYFFVLSYNENGTFNRIEAYSGRMFMAYTDMYVRLACEKSDGSIIDTLDEVTNSMSIYSTYGSQTYTKHEIDKLNGNKKLNKKWAVIGDSLSDTRNSAAGTKYYNYISDELGLSCKSYAVSGNGYAKLDGTNSRFYEQALKIDSDTDIVTIFGSFNDHNVYDRDGLGEVTDQTTDTVFGCVYQTIRNIRNTASHAVIGIMLPTPWRQYPPYNLNTLQYQYINGIKQIAAMYNIPVLDLYTESNMFPWESDFRTEYYNENGIQDDGTHPNSLGHKRIASKIKQFVESLIG